MAYREANSDELRLVRELLRIADYRDRDELLVRLRVEEMSDGGMGSLRLTLDGERNLAPSFVKQISAVQFIDTDGVAVIATLNGNERGEPFELDIWKTDFSRLLRISDEFAVLDK
jgi:hypothetical protein